MKKNWDIHFLYYYRYVFMLILWLFSCLNLVSKPPFDDNKCTSHFFEENKGQWNKEVQFKAHIKDGLDLWLTKNAFVYQFHNVNDAQSLMGHEHDHDANSGRSEIPEVESEIVRFHALKVSFKGSNTENSIDVKDPSESYVNFFRGNNPDKWARKVLSYKEITYNDLYNGIDLNLYCDGDNIKYDFIVKRHANPQEIKLEYSGADKLYISQGNLFVITSLGQVKELKPYAYQNIGGRIKEVSCRYSLTDSVITFDFPNGYNLDNQLIIDPILVASTYTGSTADNWGTTATYDKDKNIYTGGTVFGPGYPTTVGAFQVNYAAGFPNPYDLAVSVFVPDGSARKYATYLGGENRDRVHSLVVNDQNELFLYGITNSKNFPIAGLPYDSTYAGPTTVNINNQPDIFVAKFDSNGLLTNSTYVGGTGRDGENNTRRYQADNNKLLFNYGDNARGEIVLDENGDVLIASSTSSLDFPVVNGFQSSIGGSQDACVFKLSSDLGTLEWSTFLGGTNQDAGYAVALGAGNDVYVTGGTMSSNFPVTSGVLNTSYGGNIDGFLVRISSDGTVLKKSTYLGTSSYDQSFLVQTDGNFDVYVFGQTKGAYPVQPVSSKSIYSNAGSSQFVHKLSQDLSSTIFSTVVGNGDNIPNISPTAFLVDTCGFVYLSGWSRCENGIGYGHYRTGIGTVNGMPITADAAFSTTDGCDFYLMVLDRDAESLRYSTFFGEDGVLDHVDGGTSRFDKKGIVYQSVCASCGPTTNGFPTTAGAYSSQDLSSGRCNNAVFKFDFQQQLFASAGVDADGGCAPLNVNFSNTSVGAKYYLWDFGDGTTSTDSIPSHVYTDPGLYNVTLVVIDSNKCIVADTTQIPIDVYDPGVELGPDKEICFGDQVQLNAVTTADSVIWSPSTGLNNVKITNPIANPSITTEYVVTSYKNGCIDSDTIEVIVNSNPTANFTAPEVCNGVNMSFTDMSSMDVTSWSWDFGDGNSSNVENPSHGYGAAGIYNVTLEVENGNSCTDQETLPVLVRHQPTADFSVPSVCLGGTSIFTNLSGDMDSITSIQWDFGDGNNSGLSDPTHVYGIEGLYDVTLDVSVDGQCNAQQTKKVLVRHRPTASFTANEVCKGVALTFNNTSTNKDSITTWTWDLGDGNNSNSSDPVHTYNSEGVQSVTLMVTTGFCTDQVTLPVLVRHQPTADFSVPSVCLGGTSIFTNLSGDMDSITSIQWDFGDGNNSGLSDPTHVYGIEGLYDVTLDVLVDGQCNAQQTKKVLVRHQPTASFTANEVCKGVALTFNNTSTNKDSITTWTWDLGDGNNSNSSDPVHTYNSEGVQSVTLMVTTGFCTDQVTLPVLVRHQPTADFSVPSVCLGGTSIFTNLSGDMDSITSMQWDFGDGNNSGLSDPTHVYGIEGLYDVTLDVSVDGQCNAQQTKKVLVRHQPTASFTANEVCKGVALTFNNTSTNKDSITTWTWDLGDGNNSNSSDPVHTYNSEGVQSVTLMVTTGFCTDQVTLPVLVRHQPTADFSVPSVCLGGTSIFTNLSGDMDSITSMQWDFGDGNNSGLSDPTHVYGIEGLYDVTLDVSVDGQCNAQQTKKVLVRHQPTASFTANEVCKGVALTFNNTSTNKDSITTWTWDLGDGNNSNSSDPVHTYNSEGVQSVTLMVTTGFCTDQVTLPVLVRHQPTADFSVPSVCLGGTSIFTNLSGDMDSITSMQWDFGDGNNSGLSDPTHVYGIEGLYDVTLDVSVDGQCNAQQTKKVLVRHQPTASFTANEVCKGVALTFNNTSTNKDSITTWTWDLGDGNNSNSSDPVHTYNSEGVQSVTLMVTTGFCTDQVTLPVLVRHQPTADFSVPSVCLGGTSIFTNLSGDMDSITSMQWDFGDGNNSGLSDPTHVYGIEGLYDVTLDVSVDGQCNAQQTKKVLVRHQPTASFTANEVCKGVALTFNNTSTNKDSITTWTWDLGDGNNSNSSDPVHTYNSEGVQSVTLMVTTGFCTDQVTLPVLVRHQPTADFSVPSVCLGGTSIFTNLSGDMDSITSMQWDFGDGNNSGLSDPTHVYGIEGLYDVTLDVSVDGQCNAQQTKKVLVRHQPIADFENQVVCRGVSFNFNNLSTNIDSINSFNWDFGDGNVSSDPFPNNVYLSEGLNNVSLTVSTLGGCSSNVNKPILVRHQPLANFNSNVVCEGDTTMFTNLSMNIDSITNFEWNFGNGNISKNPNVVFQFEEAGSYPVTLIVSVEGQCTDTITKNVLIRARPQANFTVNDVCNGSLSNFSNLTEEADSVDQWNWDFGDGTNSNIETPNHLYSDTGTYIVTLVASVGGICNTSITKPVNVIYQPTANFVGTEECFGVYTEFTDSSMGMGEIDKWYWTFGDGGFSNLQNPTHLFESYGTFLVTLTVGIDSLCTDSITKEITVVSQPIAKIEVDDVCLGDSLLFTDLSVDQQFIDSWLWSFGDGDSSVIQNPYHSYELEGTFNVELLVGVQNKCYSRISKTVNVYPYPIVDFIAENVCEGTIANFKDLSITPDLSLIKWNWDFGDGNISNETDPNHLYENPGDYSVYLEVEVNNGKKLCSSFLTKDIMVVESPEAAFEVADDCEGSNFKFINNSESPSPPKWTWNFGDGSFSNNEKPDHVYSVAGEYFVNLSVTSVVNGVECTSNLTKPVIVVFQPTAAMRFDNVCTGEVVEFVDESIDRVFITSWNWDFGDNSFSDIPNPSHKYENVGAYNVSLEVKVESGDVVCLDKTDSIVQIYPKPYASFFSNPEVGQATDPFVIFTDYSCGGVSGAWEFGDGETEGYLNGADAFHHYNEVSNNKIGPWEYLVTLTIVNEFGCVDDTTKPVKFEPFWSFFTPNVFTPNSDGQNDVFTGKGEGIVSYEMQIFNRWGEMVFKTDDLYEGWDGYVWNSKKIAKQDVYVWKVQLINNLGDFHEFIGHVTLVK